MIKLLISIVVIAALGAGLYFSGWYTKIVAMVMKPQTEQAPVAQNTQATTTEQAPKPVEPVNDLPTATNDASDAAIAQDAASLDIKIQELGTDTTGVTASLSDKPVTQEY